MLKNEKTAVFITFTYNVDLLNINDMLMWLNNNKKNYHLIIFTNNPYSSNYNSNRLCIIKLENSYDYWWLMEKKVKKVLFKEIYHKFIKCLSNSNIIHNFPKKFKKTHYGKNK
jgi:hypothetical protein